ncbi:MAG: cytochrome c [Oscillochloris sp.]|nr:cytochrome c [Oscillochloris sp.]
MRSVLWSSVHRAGGVVGACLLVCFATWACSAGPAVPPPEPTSVAAFGDAVVGRAIFQGEVLIEGSIACRTCHTIDPTLGDSVGPNLAGVAVRAAERIPGMAPEEYLRQSILTHDAYVVEGFSPGLVQAVVGGDFADILPGSHITDLVAFLQTLDQAAFAGPPTLVAAAAAATHTPLPAVTPTATRSPSATPTPQPTASPEPTATETSTPIPTLTSAPGATATTVPTTAGSATAVAPSDTVVAPSPTQIIPSATPLPPTATTEPPTAAPTPQPPSPTPLPPSPTFVPPTATPPPPELPSPTLRSMPDDPNLAVYAGCITCHNVHPNQVFMPHPVNPMCSTCHSGSPNRIGCPSCHSMHNIYQDHPEDANLACESCHTNGTP